MTLHKNLAQTEAILLDFKLVYEPTLVCAFMGLWLSHRVVIFYLLTSYCHDASICYLVDLQSCIWQQLSIIRGSF